LEKVSLHKNDQKFNTQKGNGKLRITPVYLFIYSLIHSFI